MPAVPLSRGVAIIDTLHPVYEGRAFFWAGDKGCENRRSRNMGPAPRPTRTVSGSCSPFFYLLNSSDNELRRRLETSEPTGFDIIDELRDEGQTDYVGMVQRFDQEAPSARWIASSRWLTMRPGGFSDADLAALRRLVPLLAWRSSRPRWRASRESLVEIYLGRDAGRRVLGGRMSRGAVERINAVLWYSDLQATTRPCPGPRPLTS